jgi:glycosyl transferase, family 25
MHFRKFVINLATRPDRRAEMERQLASVGWDAEFIEAVRPQEKGDFPSIGARGCFLSHLETLRRGRGSNILLMEDDLNFAPNFATLWPRAISELPNDWSIFYPAHKLESRLIHPGTKVLCTHMIAFNLCIVERLIHELEVILLRPGGHELGGPMHIDGAYSTIREQNPDMRSYSYSPPLGYQRSSFSDIAERRFFDRSPLLKEIVGIARALRNTFR